MPDIAKLVFKIIMTHKHTGWYGVGPTEGTGLCRYVAINCECGWESKWLHRTDPYATTKAYNRHVSREIAKALRELKK